MRSLLVLVAVAALLSSVVASGLEDLPAANPSPSSGGTQQSSSAQQGGGAFDECKTCVFVLERIKKGTNLLLPSICSEIYAKFPQAYSFCHQTLNALSLNGNNVRYWLYEGCYKYEVYQAKEWVRPCPSHVMCSVLKKLDNQPFCRPLPIEDPFANQGSSASTSAPAAQ